MMQKEKHAVVLGGIALLAFGVLCGSLAVYYYAPRTDGSIAASSSPEKGGVVVAASTPGKPSLANFAKIKIGMSVSDARSLMGESKDGLTQANGDLNFQSVGNVQYAMIWIDEDGRAFSAGFDGEDGKVTAKGPFTVIYTPQRPGSPLVITKRGGP